MRLLVIGEAPGQTEIKMGKPFLGRSGVFLKATLYYYVPPEVVIKYDNVCSFCPLKGTAVRSPTKRELAEEIPKFLERIRFHRPDFIITVGKVAEHALLGSRFEEIMPIRSTIHPSYALRFGRRDQFAYDIAQFAKEMTT